MAFDGEPNTLRPTNRILNATVLTSPQSDNATRNPQITKARVQQSAGTAMQVSGTSLQASGKTVKMVGRATSKAGSAMRTAGAAMSRTGVGAIAGVPLALAGTGVQGAGTAAQGVGTVMDRVGRSTRRAGRQLRRRGDVTAKVSNTIRSVKATGTAISAVLWCAPFYLVQFVAFILMMVGLGAEEFSYSFCREAGYTVVACGLTEVGLFVVPGQTIFVMSWFLITLLGICQLFVASFVFRKHLLGFFASRGFVMGIIVSVLYFVPFLGFAPLVLLYIRSLKEDASTA